jgi:hypothetical protein
MAASREEVDRWIQWAIAHKCEFIISVCDTFDWDDYPVYCEDKNELILVVDNYDGVNMQRINEIIQIKDGIAIENLNVRTIL